MLGCGHYSPHSQLARAHARVRQGRGGARVCSQRASPTRWRVAQANPLAERHRRGSAGECRGRRPAGARRRPLRRRGRRAAHERGHGSSGASCSPRRCAKPPAPPRASSAPTRWPRAARASPPARGRSGASRRRRPFGSTSADAATASISPQARRPASISISATRATSSQRSPPAGACSICSAYTGGFAVAAARGGAQRLTLVDSSAKRSRSRSENLEANAAAAPARNAAAAPARCEQADAFEFLRADDAGYDLLIRRSAAAGARGARRRPRGARLQGSAAPRAAPRGAARPAARLRVLPPRRPREAARRSRSAPRSTPGAACACSRAGRGSRSPRRARPSGGRLPLRPAARGVSATQASRARAARFVASFGDAASRRRAAVLAGAAAPASADAALASWAEQAGVFRAASGVDALAALPRARRARGSAQARPAARAAHRRSARAGAGGRRIVRPRRERRGASACS